MNRSYNISTIALYIMCTCKENEYNMFANKQIVFFKRLTRNSNNFLEGKNDRIFIIRYLVQLV